MGIIVPNETCIRVILTFSINMKVFLCSFTNYYVFPLNILLVIMRPFQVDEFPFPRYWLVVNFTRLSVEMSRLISW